MDPSVGLGHVALIVGDLERAVGFYRDVLEMEVRRTSPDAVILKCGADYLSLRQAARPERAADLFETRRVGIEHFGVCVARADFDSYRERLQRHGVELAGEVIVHADGSRSLHFLDPDGAVVELWHR